MNAPITAVLTEAPVGRKKAGNPGMLRPAVVDAVVRDEGLVVALKRLRVGGVIFTYRCSAACRHCGLGCGPARPARRVAPGRLPALLADLRALGRVVHVGGGECMLYWDDLCAGLKRAAAAGVPPHFVETNASFAVDEATVRRRFGRLRALGVRGVLISADPWHQEFVHPERVIRARRIARELFGPANVAATTAADAAIRLLPRVTRHPAAMRDYLASHPPRLSGRACTAFADRFRPHRLEHLPLDAGWGPAFRRRDCGPEFDRVTMWEIHVDPWDRIVSNCGLVLGSAAAGGLRRLWRADPTRHNPLARILRDGGPVALAEHARTACDLEPPAVARSKCDLCYRLRSALRGRYPELVGPAEIY